MEDRLTFIYDGECPFCNHFAELIELKSKLSDISIILLSNSSLGQLEFNGLSGLYITLLSFTPFSHWKFPVETNEDVFIPEL